MYVCAIKYALDIRLKMTCVSNNTVGGWEGGWGTSGKDVNIEASKSSNNITYSIVWRGSGILPSLDPK